MHKNKTCVTLIIVANHVFNLSMYHVSTKYLLNQFQELCNPHLSSTACNISYGCITKKKKSTLYIYILEVPLLNGRGAEGIDRPWFTFLLKSWVSSLSSSPSSVSVTRFSASAQPSSLLEYFAFIFSSRRCFLNTFLFFSFCIFRRFYLFWFRNRMRIFPFDTCPALFMGINPKW